MKAVPYNEAGISYDDFMGDDALDDPVPNVRTDWDDFPFLLSAWIDKQAGGELGGEGGDGTWAFEMGEDEDGGPKRALSGKELLEFVKEQVGSLPVGFWILEDLHYEAALVPLEDTCDHGGATIHACAETSFMRICAKLAVCTVGSADPPGVSGGGGE